MTPRVEIWELIGPYWCLPLRVVWHDTLAEIRVGAGASLTRKMLQVAEETLTTVATLRGTTFWATLDRLEKVARRFWGDDPEDVIQWLPTRSEKAPVRNDYEPDEFVKGYCQSSLAIISDTLLVQAVWVSLCKFMLHRLLNEKRSVDLSFAQLQAFCLRRNWAGAVAKNEREYLKDKKFGRGEYLNRDRQNMIKRGLGDYLVSKAVTSFDEKSRTICYTLDCRTNEKWDEMVRTIELTKAAQARGGYMNTVATQLRRQLPEVLDSYAHYLKEACRPNAMVSETVFVGTDRKRKRKPGKRSSTRPAGPWDSDVVLRSFEDPVGLIS